MSTNDDDKGSGRTADDRIKLRTHTQTSCQSQIFRFTLSFSLQLQQDAVLFFVCFLDLMRDDICFSVHSCDIFLLNSLILLTAFLIFHFFRIY